ncbi:hypothetical protein Tco_0652250 [Tanacetum coccineum]|uniref:Uncharacterized protein n=1 Tax=Tanacetum coccineum TaxID=301880 RepID=A0ABQ4WXR8_9ASTR
MSAQVKWMKLPKSSRSKYETPLCKAFNEFNYLLKINMDLFIFEIQEIKTYEEYEMDNNMTGELEEPCSNIDGDHKWYDKLTDGKLKEEALTHKARIEESWGDATPGVMKFCEWLKNRPYANAKTKKDYDPYLDNNRIFEKNYKANKAGDTQDTKKERHDLSICNIRRFEMIKYSFRDDEEYAAIKEIEYDDLTNTSKEAIHAYQ